MSGGLEDSEDLCDPDDPRYLWEQYDLEVWGFLGFPRGYRILSSLDRTEVIYIGLHEPASIYIVHHVSEISYVELHKSHNCSNNCVTSYDIENS